MNRFLFSALGFSLALTVHAQQKSAEPPTPKSPAQNLAEFITTHADENSFVNGLETMFRDRFTNLKDSASLFSLCQQLGSTGTFGLPHATLRALGEACQSADAKVIRAEFAKLSKGAVVREFANAVRQHVQARGSVEAFAHNLSTTLPGNEKPLLAFGIFVLFAT